MADRPPAPALADLPAIEVDAVGLLCPLPVLRAEQAMARLPPCGLLALVGDDPGLEADLLAWCAGNGHVLLDLGPASPANPVGPAGPHAGRPAGRPAVRALVRKRAGGG